MTLVVRAAPSEHYGWVVNRVGCVPTSDMRAIECLDENDGRILGMVLYTGWMKNSVQMHVAIETPIAVRRLLRPAFSYPFEEVGVGVVLGLVVEENLKALNFDKHLGFKEVARLRDAWEAGKDLVLFEMRKEDCRWLKKPERKDAP